MRPKTYKRKVDEQLKPKRLKLREPKCPEPTCGKKLSKIHIRGPQSDQNKLGGDRDIERVVPQHPSPKCESYKAYYRVYGKRNAVP